MIFFHTPFIINGLTIRPNECSQFYKNHNNITTQNSCMFPAPLAHHQQAYNCTIHQLLHVSCPTGPSPASIQLYNTPAPAYFLPHWPITSKHTTVQYTSSCMFPAPLAHHQQAYNCTIHKLLHVSCPTGPLPASIQL